MTLDIRVPNIGDFRDVPIVEVLVKAGDVVALEDPLVSIESEKATMEVPSPQAGVVRSVAVKIGDKVSEGSALMTIESATGDGAAPPNETPSPAVAPAAGNGASTVVELRIPDIGDFKDIPVIEVLVAPGDKVEREAPLVTLESEKAALDVPASASGTIRDVKLKVGDMVSMGSLIALLDVTVSPAPAASAPPPDAAAGRTAPAPSSAGAPVPQAQASSPPAEAVRANGFVHASPAIRRFARELGVDLHGVRGSGPHARITRDDVQGFVRTSLSAPSAAHPLPGGLPFDLPTWPNIDFGRFGPVEVVPLSRIRKVSGPNVHRNWISIPHVTNNDEADITDLEAFRKRLNAESPGAKVTMLAFVVKAVVVALRAHPDVNSSLDGETLVRKRYYNIGFAADTPNGLMVPVLHGADNKGVLAIATETAALAAKARDGKLDSAEMQGATFTISSLGGIGGTSFTPIVNAPEVAILGVSRSALRPVWNGTAFVPRLMLPLSLSYDHRVIDGALAARFNVTLAAALADLRRALL